MSALGIGPVYPPISAVPWVQTSAGYCCLHDCSPAARKGKLLLISSCLFCSQSSKVSLALILKYFHPDQNLENQLPKKKPLWPSHSHNWAISKEQPQEKSYVNMALSYSAENWLRKCVWSNTCTTEPTELTDTEVDSILTALYQQNC